MSFLSPLFLLGALAAAIPVVLHFLHREPEPRVKFPAVRLLRHAPVEDARHRRLREWLLLALRVAALAFIAAAFARPFLSHALAGGGRLTIVALDTSMSMSAPGRFARAQALAKDAVARAPAGERVGIVAFDDSAAVAQPPTVDRALAIAALDRAAAGFGGTSYRAALGAAANAIEAAGNAPSTIVVVTDLQANGWDAGAGAALPAGADVRVVDAGHDTENFAVTALSVTGSHASVTIRNDARAGRDAHVRLAVDGRSAGEATVTIGPGASAEAGFDGVHGAGVSATVDDANGIQGDNTRFAVAGAEHRPVVAVVTTNGDPGREAFYVQQALAAGGADARFSVQGLSTAGAATLSARPDEIAAVFLLSTKGLDERGRSALSGFVRGGGGIFVAGGPDVDSDVVTQSIGVAMPPGAAGAPASGGGGGPEGPRYVRTPEGLPSVRTLVPADVRHPVFKAFGARVAALGLARFSAVSPVPREGCAVIASFTTGEAALSDCAIGEGRALVFGSDLDDRANDLPLHPAFVPFVQESADYLAGGRKAAADVLISAAPRGVPRVPGIAALPAAGGHPGRRVAVNVDPSESDSERLTAAEFDSAVSRLREGERPALQLRTAEREDSQRLWQYALALAIALLVAESVVAARTA